MRVMASNMVLNVKAFETKRTNTRQLARGLVTGGLFFVLSFKSPGDDAQQPAELKLKTSFDQMMALAEKRDGDAEFGIALRYAKGEGVAQDFKEVYKWLNKAGSHATMKDDVA